MIIKSGGILRMYTYIYLFHSVLHCSFLLLSLEPPHYPSSKFPQPCRRNATESALEKSTKDKMNPAMHRLLECFKLLEFIAFIDAEGCMHPYELGPKLLNDSTIATLPNKTLTTPM